MAMLEEGKTDNTTTSITKGAPDADVVTIGDHVFQMTMEIIKDENGSFFVVRATEIITKDVFEFKADEKSLLAMNWPNNSMESVKKFLTSVIFDADAEMTVKYGFIKTRTDSDNNDDNKEEKKEAKDDKLLLEYEEGDDMVIMIELEYKWMKQNWRLDLKWVAQDEVKRLKVLVKDLRQEITQLQSELLSFKSAFRGTITMWSGSVSEIPPGWALCNGSNGTPNLTDRFIMGCNGSGTNISTTGGSQTHSHDITVNGHRLTIDEMPSHSHGFQCGEYCDGSSKYKTVAGSGSTEYTYGTGGNQAHSHGASSNNTGHIPPYYALAFIMKL